MENDRYNFSLPIEVTYEHFPQGCLMAGCLNGGSCLFDEGKDAFACSCSPQWRGEKCEMGRSKLFFFSLSTIDILGEE